MSPAILIANAREWLRAHNNAVIVHWLILLFQSALAGVRSAMPGAFYHFGKVSARFYEFGLNRAFGQKKITVDEENCNTNLRAAMR